VVRFGAVAAGFCLAVAGVELLRGSGWGAALLAGVSLAIATMPEEFPLVYTLYLALGARRLAREHALVRQLAAVETLGATTVICTDKTGTLTLGHVGVAALVTAGGARHVGMPIDDEARRLLEAAVLASEPQPFDPLDQAIVQAAREYGVDVDALHSRTFVHDYAFDPLCKYLSHVWRDADGRLFIAAKGAVEGLLERIDPEFSVRRLMEARNARLAEEGMRVIAIAGGDLAVTTGQSQDEHGLRFLGLLGFRDALRPGVAEAVRDCVTAGIRVVMITGDHPVTAHAVAEGIGLPHDDSQIATGADLDAADGLEFTGLARATAIFSRTRPEQKHRLVRAFQAEGDIVAMTGDGINDAPALREADIGVAMGRRGTEVAREAATMVLLDDNFATIVLAIREGRRIFDNLRVAFAYLVAYHVPLLAAALLVPMMGEPLMLLPVHLILLQVVGHPTAALAFEGDQPAHDVMRRPPRSARVSLLSRRTLRQSLWTGMALAVAVLGMYFLRRDRGGSVRDARTTAFLALLVGEILLVIIVRAGSEGFWRVGTRGNRTLVIVLAASVAIAAAVFLVGPLRGLLRLDTIGLGWAGLATIAAAVLTCGAAGLLVVLESRAVSRNARSN
jgi:Ca2+-transporting ATPase